MTNHNSTKERETLNSPEELVTWLRDFTGPLGERIRAAEAANLIEKGLTED